MGQTFSRNREADDDALWLPVSGDFASKARDRGADKKIAKPFVTIWRYDFRTSTLCPDNEEGWFAHWIRIRPAVVESAPYFVAFVANSLSSNARLEITDPEISMSHPVTENLEASESPGTSWGAVIA